MNPINYSYIKLSEQVLVVQSLEQSLNNSPKSLTFIKENQTGVKLYKYFQKIFEITDTSNTNSSDKKIKKTSTNLQTLKTTMYKETYFPVFLLKKNLRGKKKEYVHR